MHSHERPAPSPFQERKTAQVDASSRQKMPFRLSSDNIVLECFPTSIVVFERCDVFLTSSPIPRLRARLSEQVDRWDARFCAPLSPGITAVVFFGSLSKPRQLLMFVETQARPLRKDRLELPVHCSHDQPVLPQQDLVRNNGRRESSTAVGGSVSDDGPVLAPPH